MRFIVETERALQLAGKSASQVLWVGSKDGVFYMSWETFVSQFEDLTYQRFSNAELIAKDLVIVGGDWWLERTQDGITQLWELKQYPRRRGQGLTFRKILSRRGTPTGLRRLNPQYGVTF